MDNLPRTIILVVILYSCDMWSLILRGEQRIQVFENKTLREIFWYKRGENGEWKMLDCEEDFIICTIHLIYSYIIENWNGQHI